MMTALRRRSRLSVTRVLVILVLLCLAIWGFSYFDMRFCFKLLARSNVDTLCHKYREREYSGSLCEELCGNHDTFQNYKCPRYVPQTTVFKAEKNGDEYTINLAEHNSDDLAWTNSEGVAIYPKIEEFHSIVKMHIILSYNVTLDDNMIRALINQEIDNDNSKQMLNFWRLFKDNNYMISKLFDEESIFPTILGSCGPYYATESLDLIKLEAGFMDFYLPNRQKRLKFILNIMEYIFRLDEMKPEPLKMCEMRAIYFGLTPDRRFKYQNAKYVYVESQLDKRLSNGVRCEKDKDCAWQRCWGKCDTNRHICMHIQQNNNFQIFCDRILQVDSFWYSILTGMSIPETLLHLIQICANPELASKYQMPGRAYAPNMQLSLRLYNEFKSLYQLELNRQDVG